jgi:hypothetical protein
MVEDREYSPKEFESVLVQKGISPTFAAKREDQQKAIKKIIGKTASVGAAVLCASCTVPHALIVAAATVPAVAAIYAAKRLMSKSDAARRLKALQVELGGLLVDEKSIQFALESGLSKCNELSAEQIEAIQTFHSLLSKDIVNLLAKIAFYGVYIQHYSKVQRQAERLNAWDRFRNKAKEKMNFKNLVPHPSAMYTPSTASDLYGDVGNVPFSGAQGFMYGHHPAPPPPPYIS